MQLLLKNWSADVFSMYNLSDIIPKLHEDWEENDYVCSGILSEIYSEYRVFVNEDKVVGIQKYCGIFEFPDSSIIFSIIDDIKKYRAFGNRFPLSYTLDVAVTSVGTVLLEVHNFVSCGTYGFCGEVLFDMYKNGIEFELSNRM